MLSQLTRILLALVTAFVFTGQMEAAARHCARLAHATAIPENSGQTPAACHEAEAAVSIAHGQNHRGGEAAKLPGADHCECMAALNGWTSVDGSRANASVATYAWLRPHAVQFASSQIDPDLRPPRA